MKSIRNDLESLKEKRGQVASHPGLLLQRYLHETAAGEDVDAKQKQDILQAAIKASANSETQQLYKTAFDRWQKCLPKESTQSSTLQTVGRLIVGLGTENVFGTGIRLHHTYGMPVLPGSALKGLAAHYCDQIWGERDNPNASDIAKKWRAPRNKDQRNNPDGEDQGSFHKLFFGATDDAGCVIFHDGWFVPGSSKEPLKLDVMTPHHSGWNNVVNPQAPTDFDSPIPVPFVSVSGQFFVAVTWRGPKDEKQAWKWFFERAMECLQEALFHWGIGGKTSSGYGRIQNPPPPPPPEPYKGKTNEIVNCLLLKERTKKGGWRAQIVGHRQIGPIQNTDQVPAGLNPGDTVQLLIYSINDREAGFKWPLTPRL
jgi:CRISPR-associated protein Cmr6